MDSSSRDYPKARCQVHGRAACLLALFIDARVVGCF